MPGCSYAYAEMSFELPALYCRQLHTRYGLPDDDGSFPDAARGDRLPVLVGRRAPVFPQAARNAGAQGKVFLQTLIDHDGQIQDLCVMHSEVQHAGFEEAAVDAVRHWRYEPALRAGRPVAIRFYIAVDFTIQ